MAWGRNKDGTWLGAGGMPNWVPDGSVDGDGWPIGEPADDQADDQAEDEPVKLPTLENDNQGGWF